MRLRARGWIRIRFALSVFVLTLAGGQPLGAQVATVTPFPVGYGGVPRVDWSEASEAFARGELGRLTTWLKQRLTHEGAYVCPIERRNCTPDNAVAGSEYFDWKKHEYFAVFPVELEWLLPSGDSSHVEPRLARVALREPQGNPYERLITDVDGNAKRMFEIVFFPQNLSDLEDAALDSTSAAAWFASQYQYEAFEDEFVATLPAFVRKYLPTDLISAAATDGGPALMIVNEVPVPFERAKISIKDRYQEPGTEEPLEASDVYFLAPTQRWSLGVLVGGAIGSAGSTHVELKDGTIARGDLGGSLTMGVVHFHFKGFHPKASQREGIERLRGFLGVIATPRPGLGAGLSLEVLRGLSINVGGGGFVVDATREGDKIGSAPMGSHRDDPFKTGWSWTMLLAAGFAFP